MKLRRLRPAVWLVVNAIVFTSTLQALLTTPDRVQTSLGIICCSATFLSGLYYFGRVVWEERGEFEDWERKLDDH